MSAKIFHSRQPQLPGSSYDEVVARARKEFNTIRRITKRQPYVRSKYFRGDKVFMTVFWDHLIEKHQHKIITKKSPPRCSLKTTCRRLWRQS